MNLFHKEKNECEQCKEKFSSYEELIHHARHVHHHDIVKCTQCGKEFIHETDRLAHSREEHKKKIARRAHKDEYVSKSMSAQDNVDASMKKFSDNF